jgi:hypothetical protein
MGYGYGGGVLRRARQHMTGGEERLMHAWSTPGGEGRPSYLHPPTFWYPLGTSAPSRQRPQNDETPAVAGAS